MQQSLPRVQAQGFWDTALCLGMEKRSAIMSAARGTEFTWSLPAYRQELHAGLGVACGAGQVGVSPKSGGPHKRGIFIMETLQSRPMILSNPHTADLSDQMRGPAGSGCKGLANCTDEALIFAPMFQLPILLPAQRTPSSKALRPLFHICLSTEHVPGVRGTASGDLEVEQVYQSVHLIQGPCRSSCSGAARCGSLLLIPAEQVSALCLLSLFSRLLCHWAES